MVSTATVTPTSPGRGWVEYRLCEGSFYAQKRFGSYGGRNSFRFLLGTTIFFRHLQAYSEIMERPHMIVDTVQAGRLVSPNLQKRLSRRPPRETANGCYHTGVRYATWPPNSKEDWVGSATPCVVARAQILASGE